MSKNVFCMLITQVALIRKHHVTIGSVNGIKNANREDYVPCRDRGTLDPLTLVVKGVHRYCFYLMAAPFFTETHEKQSASKIEMIRRENSTSGDGESLLPAQQK